MDTVIFVLKILLPSLGISLAIKFIAPVFSIAPTLPIVLSAILLPSLILMMLLMTQAGQPPRIDTKF